LTARWIRPIPGGGQNGCRCSKRIPTANESRKNRGKIDKVKRDRTHTIPLNLLLVA